MPAADRVRPEAFGFNLDPRNSWRSAVRLSPRAVVQIERAQVAIHLHDDRGRWRGLWRRWQLYGHAERQHRLRLDFGGFVFYELPLWRAWRDVSILTRGLLSWTVPIYGRPLWPLAHESAPPLFGVAIEGFPGYPFPPVAVRVCVVAAVRPEAGDQAPAAVR